jgi:hypothetical protein
MIKSYRSLVAVTLGFLAASLASAAEVTVYVGTYTDGTSKGIYRFSLDLETGKATAPALAGEAKNPSFLALHPNGRFLYAASEVDDFGGAKTGSVIAFAIDKRTGDLTRLNEVASEGGAPCHLVVDKGGKNVLVANYGGGTVAVLPIGPDGLLKKASAVRTHEGKGPNAQRQDKPHAHGIYLDAAERFALSPDLGADRVFVSRFDAAKGGLEAHGEGVLDPGAGPRHLAFHPSGRFVYVINELSLDRLRLRLRRGEGPAHAAPDRLRAAGRLQGHELHGRGRGLARRPLPLRLEPRARQPGDLRDRPGERPAHARRARADRRPLAPALQDRRLRARADRRAPARRHGRLVPSRPEDRPAEPARDDGLRRQARLRAAGAARPLAEVRCRPRSTRASS